MHFKRSLCNPLMVLSLGAVLVGACGTPTQAASVYNDVATFLAAVQPDYYYEGFGSLAPVGDLGVSSMDFAGNGYAYTIATDELWALKPYAADPDNIALSCAMPDSPILITFSSGNVSAVGGCFFPTLVTGEETVGNVIVNLSDGTTQQSVAKFTPSVPFLGFTTDGSVFIESLMIQADLSDGIEKYPTIDDMYVGSVPEPAFLQLAGLLALGGFGLRFRRRA
jgi:hypothetical protein